MRNAYRDLDRKPERKTRWETFVPMEFEEIIWEGLDWVYLVQDAKP
jgi:hypothetical protein